MSTIDTNIPSHKPRLADQPPAARRVTEIRPAGGWRWLDPQELWHFRELFLFLTWRDIKVRYKQTVIGAGWAILQPVLMMVVFSVFLGRLGGFASSDIPYPVFVFAGLVPWTLFATAVSQAGNSVVGSEKLITKIYFPRIIIPVAASGTALVDALIASSLLLVMLLGTGNLPQTGWILAPALLVVIGMCAVGVGMWLAALNVAYRDFRYVIPFLVQLWLFATPSVYMKTGDLKGKAGAPDWLQAVCVLNPLTGLIDAFRASLIDQPVSSTSLAISLGISMLFLVSGCLYFKRVEHRFADIV